MQEATVDATTGSFRSLAIEVREAGLLDRRPGYYSLKIGLTVALFAAGWAGLLILGNSWDTLGVAAFLGIMFTQLGFLGHDAGHLQVFRSRRANRMLGLTVGNALVGVCFGWWVPKHNAHHAHPNQVSLDPDMGEGFVAFSSAGQPADGRRNLGQILAARQAQLFFPLMLFRSLGLHISGIQKLVRQRDRAAALEGALIATHIALYLTVVFWVLSPLKAIAFIAVQQGLFSLYLGCSFAPNHKGMAVIDADARMGFALRQVVTARNVTGGWFVTLMLGGLNYQIEHHLFPTMPRPNLPRAQSLVREFCVESDLGYCEASVLGSYRQIISHVKAVADGALVPQAAGAG